MIIEEKLKSSPDKMIQQYLEGSTEVIKSLLDEDIEYQVSVAQQVIIFHWNDRMSFETLNKS